MSQDFYVRRRIEVDHAHRMVRRRAALIRQVVLAGSAIVGVGLFTAIAAAAWVLS